jgi:hypothetical protein
MTNTLTSGARPHRLLLAARLLLAGGIVAVALWPGANQAAAVTLNPACVQRCDNNSTLCVQGCKGNTSCVKECRNIFDQCLSTCVEQ